MGGVGRFMMSFFLFFSYFFLVKFSFFWYFFFGLTEGAVSRYLRFRIFFCRFFFGRRVFYRCSCFFLAFFFGLIFFFVLNWISMDRSIFFCWVPAANFFFSKKCLWVFQWVLLGYYGFVTGFYLVLLGFT